MNEIARASGYFMVPHGSWSTQYRHYTQDLFFAPFPFCALPIVALNRDHISSPMNTLTKR